MNTAEASGGAYTGPPKRVGKLVASIEETGEMLSHGRSFVYELIAAGKLEAVKSGKRRLVLVSSIEGYVNALRAVEG